MRIMDNELSEEKTYAKLQCSVHCGDRLYWYYKEDLARAQESGVQTIKEGKSYNKGIPEEEARTLLRRYPPFSGVCVVRPGSVIGDKREVDEASDAIVVMDTYPVAKGKEPLAAWRGLLVLLEEDALIEVFSIKERLWIWSTP